MKVPYIYLYTALCTLYPIHCAIYKAIIMEKQINIRIAKLSIIFQFNISTIYSYNMTVFEFSILNI